MIKLSIYLALGIIIGNFFQIKWKTILFITLVLLLVLFMLMQLLKRKYDLSYLLGLIICCCTISSGLLTVSFHDHRNFPNHYTNKIPHITDSIVSITFRVREHLKPGLYHHKYIIDLIRIDQNKLNGRVLLNIEKDSISNIMQVGQKGFMTATLLDINKPLNPSQFDYSAYLAKKYIYHQATVAPEAIYKVAANRQSLLGYAAALRQNIHMKLKNYDFREDELSIMNALLLGQRQDISKEVYTSYVQAGAIHILAVSGLHIGIILLILQRLFKFLDYLKNGKFMRMLFILIFLWSYAVVAGLSASIVRAVTMFTVFAIAMNLKRPTNVYNTIAISIFFLLLFKPNFLFDVGFQLSYMAVLAIVTIEPLLAGLWRPGIKPIKFFWRVLTVTFAAQLGVFPISLFYFHQFPGLFFLSNLVIIPLLGIILGSGFLIIILASINILPLWMAWLYSWVIRTLNAFVNWVSDQEAAVFQNISFSLSDLIFSYIMIALILIIIFRRSIRAISISLALVLVFQAFLIFDKKMNSGRSFIVFHKSRASIIGFEKQKLLSVHADMDHNLIEKEKFLINYWVDRDLRIINSDSIHDFYLFDRHKLLVVDSLGVYNINQLKPNMILLRNSPKINFRRLVDSVNPELVIIDGSNYKSYQERWVRTCESKKIPFHQTGEKGAYIYRY